MRIVRVSSRGRRALTACVAALIASLVAACQTDQLVTGSVAAPANGIAFESVDGPPQAVFDRLVAKLTSEAEARKLPVVSRTATASWRVRLYLAAHLEGKKAGLTWVADVFDASLERAFRLSGEEQLAARRDLWAQADDAVLGRIAARALDALAAGIAGNPPVTPAPEPVGGPVIAMAEPGR
jgi:hypothetical protein